MTADRFFAFVTQIHVANLNTTSGGIRKCLETCWVRMYMDVSVSVLD